MEQEDALGLEEQGSGMYHLCVEKDRRHSASTMTRGKKKKANVGLNKYIFICPQITALLKKSTADSVTVDYNSLPAIASGISLSLFKIS